MTHSQTKSPKGSGILETHFMIPTEEVTLREALSLPFKLAWNSTRFLTGCIQKNFEEEEEEKEEVVNKHFNNPSVKWFKQTTKGRGSLKAFQNKIQDTPSTIGLILGARGKGKTALGLRILENMEGTRPLYALGIKDLPEWINTTEDLEEVPSGAFVLVDEGGVLYNSRRSNSKKNADLTELMLTARHKDLSMLFITQNSANIEVNTLRQADYLLLKPDSLLQKEFERNEIRKLYKKTDFKKHKQTGVTYIYSDEYNGYATNTLPSFWTTKISKGWRNNGTKN